MKLQTVSYNQILSKKVMIKRLELSANMNYLCISVNHTVTFRCVISQSATLKKLCPRQMEVSLLVLGLLRKRTRNLEFQTWIHFTTATVLAHAFKEPCLFPFRCRDDATKSPKVKVLNVGSSPSLFMQPL